METNPLVTIVTPSFNQASFIGDTIRSVVSQDYPAIEYFVVDGKSTDGTMEIVRRYEDQIAWWCSESDRGQSHAVNKGWSRGRGEIMAYLNSDDLLESGAVSRIVDIFRRSPDAAVVYGDCRYISSGGQSIALVKGRPCDFARLLRQGQGPNIAQPAAFFRGDLVREIGFLDDSLHYAMDFDLLLRLAQRGTLIYVPEQFASFRVHRDSKSNSATKKHWREILAVRARYGGIADRVVGAMQYAVFFAFNSLPARVQTPLRRMRGSANDKAYLSNRQASTRTAAR